MRVGVGALKLSPNLWLPFATWKYQAWWTHQNDRTNTFKHTWHGNKMHHIAISNGSGSFIASPQNPWGGLEALKNLYCVYKSRSIQCCRSHILPITFPSQSWSLLLRANSGSRGSHHPECPWLRFKPLPKKNSKFNPLPCTDLATDLLLSALHLALGSGSQVGTLGPHVNPTIPLLAVFGLLVKGYLKCDSVPSSYFVLVLLVYTSSIILYSCFFEVRAAEACSVAWCFFMAVDCCPKENQVSTTGSTPRGAFVHHAAVWILHRSQRHPNWTPGTERRKGLDVIHRYPQYMIMWKIMLPFKENNAPPEIS